MCYTCYVLLIIDCHNDIDVKKVQNFFGYKTEFFSFQNNPKNLDLSYKIYLDLWDCLSKIS